MSGRTHAELTLSEAYAKLSAIPKDGSQASVSLASVGSYEVRMGPVRRDDLNGAPQFWLELFHHGTGKSVDSFICHNIKDAAPMFEDFMWQAAYLNRSPPGGSNEQ